MPTQFGRNVSLTEELDGWVEELVASGAYGNASEVMRAGLRALKDQRDRHAAELAAIRERVGRGAIQADRGEFVEGDVDEVVERAAARARERLRQEA